MKRSPVIVLLEGKDVQRVLGVKRTTAYRILAQLRSALGKTDSQAVTLDELCRFEHLDREWAYAQFLC